MLNPNLFEDVMTELADFYPESRINNEGARWDRTLGEWFKSFKYFDNQDFIEAIKFQREGISKRFPAIQDLVIKVHEAKQKRIRGNIQKQEQHILKSGAQPEDRITPEEKALRHEFFDVLLSGDNYSMAQKLLKIAEDRPDMKAWIMKLDPVRKYLSSQQSFYKNA